MSDINYYKIGQIIKGTVAEVKTYGAFLTFTNGQTGLLHISEMSDKFVRSIDDYAKLHSEIDVKVIEVDNASGFMRLSLKQVPKRQVAQSHRQHQQIAADQIDFQPLADKLPEWIDDALIKAKEKED